MKPFKNNLQFLRRLKFMEAPSGMTIAQRKNLHNSQMDALGVGIVSGVSSFLAVFLTRMGATNFQVGLLNAMPGLTGLLLSIVIGRFLQNRRAIVPWYRGARALGISAYTLTGLTALVLPQRYIVPAVLGIWLLASLPQTVLNIAFNVVMSNMAGPRGRYMFMSRRWAILGLVSAAATTLAGQILERLAFPVNYPVVFILFSCGGVVSYIFSSRYELPAAPPPSPTERRPFKQQIRQGFNLVTKEHAFVRFSAKRLVYILGSHLAAPLFTLYYVRQAHVSDGWIGAIVTAQQALVLVGYFVWPRLRERFGTQWVLLSTTLVLSLYPILTAFTPRVELLVLYAGVTAIFQAGLNLVFFDELMKTVPTTEITTFVAVDLSAQHALGVVGPLLSTLLSTYIGVGGALIVSGCVRLAGFGLFLSRKEKHDG